MSTRVFGILRGIQPRARGPRGRSEPCARVRRPKLPPRGPRTPGSNGRRHRPEAHARPGPTAGATAQRSAPGSNGRRHRPEVHPGSNGRRHRPEAHQVRMPELAPGPAGARAMQGWARAGRQRAAVPLVGGACALRRAESARIGIWAGPRALRRSGGTLGWVVAPVRRWRSCRAWGLPGYQKRILRSRWSRGLTTRRGMRRTRGPVSVSQVTTAFHVPGGTRTGAAAETGLAVRGSFGRCS